MTLETALALIERIDLNATLRAAGRLTQFDNVAMNEMNDKADQENRWERKQSRH